MGYCDMYDLRGLHLLNAAILATMTKILGSSWSHDWLMGRMITSLNSRECYVVWLIAYGLQLYV